MQFRGSWRWLAVCLLIGCLQSVGFAQDAPSENARRVVTRVLPVYPPLARRLNLQGVVRLRVTVSADGTAKKANVVGGNPIFVKPAQDAVLQWKWVSVSQETTEIVELTFQPR